MSDRESIILYLRASHNQGRMTNDFAHLALEFGRMELSKKRQLSQVVRDDMLSLYAEKLTKNWQKICPDNNPAAYLRRMIYSSRMDAYRRFNSHRRKIEAYKDEKKSEILAKENIHESGCKLGIIQQKGLLDGRRATKDENICLRREFIRQHKLGIGSRRIANQLGLNRSTIQRWKRSYTNGPRKFLKPKDKGFKL